jgi:beta-barrel assembly-enhancing protease
VRKKMKIVVLALLVVTLSGCETVPLVAPKIPTFGAITVDTVGTIPPVETPKWEDALEDINDNRALGYGLVHMPAMEQYLNHLYGKIKETAGVPDWPGKIYIASDSSLNAHTSAAGNIFINIAVLQSFESEDEIFALLSHEFSHIYLGHQAAYNSQMLTDSVALLAIAAQTGGKGINLGGWGSQDNISMLASAVNNLLLPAWQRSVEEQADRMGATLSLRNGYSYASGFKTFLERLAGIEKESTQRKNDDTKARRETLVQARKTEVDKAIGNLTDSLNEAMSNTIASSTQNHDNAVSREEALSSQVLPLLPRPRPQPRVASWSAALKNKHTAEVLAHYALFPRIEQALHERKYKDAKKWALIAASGATAGDGTAVSYLSRVAQGMNNSAEQLNILMRNQDWPQRSWAVQVEAAGLMKASDPAKAKVFIEQQYQYFGGASRTTPDLIAFYTLTGNKNMAQIVALKCAVVNPRFRAICMDSAQTDAERQAGKAKMEARSKTIVDGWAQKWKPK